MSCDGISFPVATVERHLEPFAHKFACNGYTIFVGTSHEEHISTNVAPRSNSRIISEVKRGVVGERQVMHRRTIQCAELLKITATRGKHIIVLLQSGEQPC